MKTLLCGLTLAFGLLVLPSVKAASGYGTPALGNEYVYIEPSNTTCVAPQFLCPGSGLLTQSGLLVTNIYGITNTQTVPEQSPDGTNQVILSFSNNYAIGGIFSVSAVTATGTNYSLTLVGNPPVNAAGIPLFNYEYQYNGSNQPTTFYALVTEGAQKGNFFTVLSNTTNSLTVDPEGLTLASKDIKTITLLPYWTLSTLFPAAQATTSFIPTTNASNVMTMIVISPPSAPGSVAPQTAGQAFYFNTGVTNWVSTTNPSVPAGDAIIAPGAYVYVQNNGSNNYPLHVFISGSVLTNQFNVSLVSSPSNSVISYFSLPRNSPYQLSAIGFNDANFTQSVTKSPLARNDLLILDNGHGAIGATYYKYKSQWYDASSDGLPTNPIMPPGSVFGVVKPKNNKGTKILVNQYNLKLTSGVPSTSIFNRIAPAPTPNPAAPTPPPNTGGD